MPVDTSFLKTTLEQCLGHSVEIVRFFDFLDNVTSNCSSQKVSFSRFVQKWQSCLHKSSKKMMIVRYEGIWTPECLDKQQLTTRQERWEEFARRYDSSFTQCTVDSQSSPEYQPLNFNELVRLTFWKEIYDTFGSVIVAHIFNKCALLYEVDEGLYLIVGSRQGIIYRKLCNFERKIIKKGTSSSCTQLPITEKNPYRLCSAVIDDGVAEKENADSLSEPREHKYVQYFAGKRSRNWFATGKNQSREPPQKRLKVENPSHSHSIPNHELVAPAGTILEHRWIRPNSEVLQKVIEYRNSLLKTLNLQISNATATTSSPAKSDDHKLSYICIQSEAVFKPVDKSMVLKQRGEIRVANPKLPRDWAGLRLPGNIHTLGDSTGYVQILVYVISESLAKKLGIRIKPKGRQRKKTFGNVLNSVPNISTSVPLMRTSLVLSKKNGEIGSPHKTRQDKTLKFSTLSGRKQAILQNAINSTRQHPIKPTSSNHLQALSGNSRVTDTQISKLKPYSPSHTLSISACLYNKSSWSKWPTVHCLTKAVHFINQEDKVGSIRIIVDDIMKFGICSETAHRYMLESINQNWKASDDSNPLNNILVDITRSHSKFRDVHKLFKNCVSYWRKKCLLKQEKRRKKSILPEQNDNQDQNAVQNAPKTSQGRKTSSSTNNDIAPDFRNSDFMDEPEIIDLIQTSPCTNNMLLSQNQRAERVVTLSGPATSCAQSLSKKFSQSLSKKFSQTKVMRSGKTKGKDTSQRSMYELVRKCSGNSLKKRSFKSLKDPVPYNCVMQSLKQIFHIMKIEQLLGSKRNVRGFFKFLRKALILGGTKSSLHLSELMALIHPSDLPITHITECKLAVETFTAKVVTWLFTEYVLVLLKTCFYITESNFSRLQVKFYLRESWTSASSKMKNHLVEKGALDEGKTGNNKTTAILRYVPKQNHTLRSLLVTNKSAWSLTKEESKLCNMFLHYIDAKINKSRMYLPTTIQHEWRKFFSEWKLNGSPKLYYLRMDIRDAYPSVSLDKLKEILLAASGERRHKMVVKQYALFGSNARKRFRESLFDEQSRDNWYSGIHVRPCIAMDVGNDAVIEVWKLLNHIIRIIVTTNIVKVGKKSYQFHYGLPQGWSQSPILCSIYYGYIDSTLYLPYLESNGRLFLRVVDDYLFITPDATDILNLTQLMKMGCKKYGIKMNDEKSVNNMFVRSDTPMPRNICDIVTFCGWNFCVTCGHVSRDFKKYVGQDFCSTITFQMPISMTSPSPEQFIRLRGTLIVPARVKPIVIDPTINCYKRILLSVFEASIMLSFRFYAICRVVYPNLNALKEEDRVNLITSCIHLCCARLAKYVARNAEYHGPTFSTQERTSCSSVCCGDQNSVQITEENQPSPTVTPDSLGDLLSVDSIKYTSLHGFCLKLQNHAGVFEKVLPALNRSISKLKRKLGDSHCDCIVKVVGSKMPDYLLEILI